MFIQVIRGRTRNPTGVRAAMDRWYNELSSDAAGWLGSTCGVTGDGGMICVVRFESEDAARQNSRRPDQQRWWEEFSTLLDGPAEFDDCTKVMQMLRGGSDAAGFVQVIRGTAVDEERLRALGERTQELLPQFRPDLIGATIAVHGKGGFTQTVYFTSEAAAREGERKEPTGELKTLFEQQGELLRDLVYFDLTDPWLYSPRLG